MKSYISELQAEEMKNIQGGDLIDNIGNMIISYISEKLRFKGFTV